MLARDAGRVESCRAATTGGGAAADAPDQAAEEDTTQALQTPLAPAQAVESRRVNGFESNRVESVEAIRLTCLAPKVPQNRHRQSAILYAQNREKVQTVWHFCESTSPKLSLIHI